MTSDANASDRAVARAPKIALLLLVVLPMVVNAIALLPEVRYPTPSDNDQIFHYLFIERANQALAAGDNPFDHWLPELEGGFPQFLYYQNLPHLTVVAVHHLAFEQISLTTTLNLARYLLMVLFPLTVYWSMRRMEFSSVAAAVGAAFCSTISSRIEYGFDYQSYIWLGYGMFPQLCSMHLMFIAVACLRRVLERSRGVAAAILSSSAIVLSDLLYGYIFAVAALLLWLLSILKRMWNVDRVADAAGNLWRLTARFAMVASIAFVVSAYQTVPFLRGVQYINRVNAGGVQHVPMGISAVLSSLFAGTLFDHHRLPVVTMLFLIGMIYAAVTRRPEAKLALTFFATFVLLAFGRDILGPAFELLPLSHLIPFRRFTAGSDFAAILLVGLGGEFIWNWWPWNFRGTRTLAPMALLLILCATALTQRWFLYQHSADMMLASAEARENDTDLTQIFAALRAAPPGRVYAGSRGNWGMWMDVGGVYLYDLLPLEQFSTVMPWQSLSLNSPYLWRLNVPSPAICRLFNIRYVIAPRTIKLPPAFQRMVSTSRYVLYQIDSGGYFELGQIAEVMPMASSSSLHDPIDQWIAGDEPAQDRFLAFRSGRGKFKEALQRAAQAASSADSSQPGIIENEVVTPDSFSARITPASSGLLVLKTTYHPNWHVFVDGQERRTFMVSPSFIGVLIGPGPHEVTAEYRSSMLKKVLLVVSCLTLIATLVMWAFDLEGLIFGRLSD